MNNTNKNPPSLERHSKGQFPKIRYISKEVCRILRLCTQINSLLLGITCIQTVPLFGDENFPAPRLAIFLRNAIALSTELIQKLHFRTKQKTKHKIFLVHSKCGAFDNKFAKQTCSTGLNPDPLHTALAVYCQRGDVRNDFVRHFGFIIVKTRAANSEFATRGGVCKNRSAFYLWELFCSSLRNIPSECSCSINKSKLKFSAIYFSSP